MVAEWIATAAARLAAAGVDTPLLDAQLIAAHGLGRDRTYVLTHPEELLDPEAVEELLSRRENREPLAYLLGWREFYGRRFAVTPAVLVPRQETETLVDACLELLIPGKPAAVLDLGCGSGCIGVTLKLERPELQVTCSDVSQAALDVAGDNARSLGAYVRLVVSDRFRELENDRFDLIVANPPYVADSEALMPEVASYEPEIALYSGETGLESYEWIAEEAPRHVLRDGHLVVEIGHAQSERVRQLFEQEGWTHLRSIRDLDDHVRALVFR